MSLLPPPHLPRIAGAALTGVLVLLAFPAFGHEAGLDGLVWFALAPLFLAAAGAGGWAGFVLGWCAGLILEGAGFLWILLAIRRYTSMPGPLASLCFGLWLAYSSLAWGLLGAALGRCRRPRAVLWVLPFWVGLEHCYPRLFPWHLGGALYGREWLVQNADLLGTSGLTALVFLSSAVLYLLWSSLRGRSPFPAVSSAILVLLVAGSLVYGRLRLAEVQDLEARTPPVKVLLVQGALAPPEKNERGLRVHLEMTRAALSKRAYDLVVWPEGADNLVFDLSGGGDPWTTHREDGEPPLRLDREVGVPLIAGAAGYDARRVPRFSNVAAYLQPGQPPAFYEKNHRLLFGEQVPFLDLLPRSLRESMLRHVGTIAAGRGNPLLKLGRASFRNLICYEATLPGYVREAARGADFLVNVTEDIWYGRTAHIPQHVSVLVLRVVENRVPLVRCTNVGPSGVIDISGRFRRGEKVFEPELVEGELRPARAKTLHASLGHWFPLVLLALAVVKGAAAWRTERRESLRG
ncbi:MAG: apolipoprotein N-acyltransferase [Planctomycetes bacterium]|nr:apolipoprotein N-acyltransferase [Planctomycetota bacterium]